jgi:hypothetical protein
MLGIVNSMYAFAATDAPIHIAEEIQRPGVALPRIMYDVFVPINKDYLG